MDLYPDVPVACGVMKEGSLVTRFFESINRFCLRKSDAVVALGRCMHERILQKSIDPERVHIIGVWTDSEEVKPVPRSTNRYRKEWDIGDRLLVMYSGNFGLGHDVTLFLVQLNAWRKTTESDLRLSVEGKRRPSSKHSFATRGFATLFSLLTSLVNSWTNCSVRATVTSSVC